jgi:hypothetical protein
LLAQGITGLAALSHSQGYLSCKLTAWSCLLKELLVLQLAHRVTYLANSQDRSCLLNGLLVLQLSAAHRVTYLANSRLDSLFGPIAKSTETCSQQRNLLCISNIDNWCLRGLLFCRLLVVMLYIDSLVTRPFHSSGFLARSSSLMFINLLIHRPSIMRGKSFPLLKLLSDNSNCFKRLFVQLSD